MTLIEFDLTVITVCFVLITLFLLAILFVLYKLLKKVEEGVDTVNSQLRPAVSELRKSVKAFSDSLQTINSFLSFTKRFKRKSD